MSIFDMFRSSASSTAADPSLSAAQQKVAAPLPGGDSSTLEVRGSSDALPPGPGAPNQPATPASGKEGETSPLQGFEKLWENVNTSKGQMPSLNADPSKIAEAAKRIDFSRGVEPAQIQKALAGDSAAFMDVLNTVAQNSFSIATQASTHLVDRHTSAVADHLQKDLPTQFKNFQATDGLLSGNPLLANPAVKPLIQVIQTQLAQQFPQATSAELQAHAVKYLSGVVSAINPDVVQGTDGKTSSRKAQKQQEAQANNQFDWNTWATAEGSKQPWQ